MNTSMYKEEKQAIPSLVPLGIAMDYRVNWNVHRIIRDFVQNFYDSIGYERFADEFQYEWEIIPYQKPSGSVLQEHDLGSDWKGIEKGRMLHIRMRTLGHSFSYEWLTYIGGSTKTGKDGYAGKYGEGFKIALLCLARLGGDAVMSSGEWELHPCEYVEKIDHQKVRMFGYRMKEREDDGFTTLELYGIPASDENIRIVKEVLLEFFYPQNVLLADRIEVTDSYALYARSEMKVPCTEYVDIPGVFYYKYIARGRLPFPAVIHLKEKNHDFDSDRSRNILTEATVVDAVYKMTEKLSPEASFWMLTKMKKQWQDFPAVEKGCYTDLNTWYYVICQLVRNISSEQKWIDRFAQEQPLGLYAYMEHADGDSEKKRLLQEARRWFDEENKGRNRRRLVNPIFRLLGVPSVLCEYTEKKGQLYRELNEKEQKRAELLKECAEIIFSALDDNMHFPKILIHAERRRIKNQAYMQYGILPYAKTRTVRVFAGKKAARYIRYQVKEVVMEAEDLSTEAEFSKVLLKYIAACVHMYGTERSERSNGVLTYIGAILYDSRDKIKEYEEKWKNDLTWL